jgi:hypothetical protein
VTRPIRDVRGARAAAARVWGATPTEVALLCTPPILLFNNRTDAVSISAAGALIAISLVGSLRVSPVPWLAAAGVIAARQAPDLLMLDDHVVLATYWCAAVGFSLATENPERGLRISAALLVGIAFTFAAGWKAASPEFVDRTFFHTTMIIDHRFEPLGLLTGQPDPGPLRTALAESIEEIDAWSVFWPTGPRSGPVAAALTALGVAVEAIVALAFLAAAWATGGRSDRIRSRRRVIDHACGWSLLGFMTIYFLVPVVGFASLLGVMAAVVTDDLRWRRTLVAAAAFWFAWTSFRLQTL